MHLSKTELGNIDVRWDWGTTMLHPSITTTPIRPDVWRDMIRLSHFLLDGEPVNRPLGEEIANEFDVIERPRHRSIVDILVTDAQRKALTLSKP